MGKRRETGIVAFIKRIGKYVPVLIAAGLTVLLVRFLVEGIELRRVSALFGASALATFLVATLVPESWRKRFAYIAAVHLATFGVLGNVVSLAGLDESSADSPNPSDESTDGGAINSAETERCHRALRDLDSDDIGVRVDGIEVLDELRQSCGQVRERAVRALVSLIHLRAPYDRSTEIPEELSAHSRDRRDVYLAARLLVSEGFTPDESTLALDQIELRNFQLDIRANLVAPTYRGHRSTISVTCRMQTCGTPI